MKKSLLALVATFTLSNTLLTAISAQDTTVSEVTTEETMSQTTETIEETSVIEDTADTHTFEESRHQFLSILDTLTSNPLEDKTKKEVKNYLNYLLTNELATDEAVQSHVESLLASLEEEHTDTINVDELKENVHAYLAYTVSFVENAESVSDTEIESIWRSIKILENTKAVDTEKDEYIAMKLVIAKRAFIKLLNENFEEDGTFKEKLFSKELISVYKFLDAKEAAFVAEYKDKYDSILAEISARKEALTALKKVEEKRANGEAVSDEEFAEVERLTNKVQTSIVRENVNDTKQAVVSSQLSNSEYTPSTSGIINDSASEATPAPAPVVTEAPVETEAPVITEAPAPAFVADGVNTFYTMDDAHAYAHAYAMNNTDTIASYLAYEVPHADGTSHFEVLYEYRQ